MTDNCTGSRQTLCRSKSAGPLTRSKSLYQRKIKQQPLLILYVDEDCPLHGNHGKCTCASFVNTKNSTESLTESNNNNYLPASIKPFNNNPSLSSTQRDVVGNNLQFNSASYNNNDWIDNENDQLAALLQYRDSMKRNLMNQAKFVGGFPRMRHGRVGSQWRHVKQTNTYSGSNLMFIDGTVRIDDTLKYPIPRFGYPPMKRPQHKFSASYNDLSSNPATRSLDTFTWSGNDSLNQRQSLSQYSNRFQNQSKSNNFDFWSNKSRPADYSHNEYEVNQPVQERTNHGAN